MAIVTVPGANGSVVTQSYNSSANFALATAIQAQLIGLQAAGLLNAQDYTGGTTPAPVSGMTNELVIPPGTSSVAVPSGYTFLVDSTSGGSLSITGGQNFLGGSGDTTFTNMTVAGGGIDTIAAGDGSNTLNLVAGTAYDAAVGNGGDVFNAAGIGTLQGGTGVNIFNLAGGADTIFAGANALKGVFATAGAAETFYAGVDGLDYISGGSGGNTIVGASGNEVLYANSNGPGIPSTLFVAGSGNETLWGAANTGNEALYADRSSGGADSLIGGFGTNAFVAGTGNDTMLAASQSNVFYFAHGQAGGNDAIQAFGGNDIVALVGYNSAAGAPVGSAAQAAIAGATATSAGLEVKLADNTTITFSGLTSGSQLAGHIISS